jgi:magnesium-transporting ATPase (P-type)
VSRVTQVERADGTKRLASGAPWHALTATDISARLEVGPTGLGEDEVRHRLQRFGANRLKTAPRRPAWRRFLEQFRSVLIQVLLVAALVTMLIGDRIDAIVILAVVVINAVIGFIQEGKAESAMAPLSKMLPRRRGCCAGAAGRPSTPSSWCLATMWRSRPAIGCRRTCASSRPTACAPRRPP